MLTLLALLAQPPAHAGHHFEVSFGVGPDGPAASQTVESSEIGLLHARVLSLSEREQLEFRVYLDEHITGDEQLADQFRFSAEIYKIQLNRRGEEKRRELVSRPRILTMDQQPARIVQGARDREGVEIYRLELEVTPIADAGPAPR